MASRNPQPLSVQWNPQKRRPLERPPTTPVLRVAVQGRSHGGGTRERYRDFQNLGRCPRRASEQNWTPKRNPAVVEGLTGVPAAESRFLWRGSPPVGSMASML